MSRISDIISNEYLASISYHSCWIRLILTHATVPTQYQSGRLDVLLIGESNPESISINGISVCRLTNIYN